LEVCFDNNYLHGLDLRVSNHNNKKYLRIEFMKYINEKKMCNPSIARLFIDFNSFSIKKVLKHFSKKNYCLKCYS